MIMHSAFKHSDSPHLTTSFIDECESPDTILMKRVEPRLKPTSSPPPAATRHYTPRFNLDSGAGNEGLRDPKVEPRPDDVTLISSMDGGRNYDIIEEAGRRALPSEADVESNVGDGCHSSPEQRRSEGNSHGERQNGYQNPRSSREKMVRSEDELVTSLPDLAGQALEFIVGDPQVKPEQTTSMDIRKLGRLSIHDRANPPGPQHQERSPHYKEEHPFTSGPRSILPNHANQGLPPIMSPGSEASGRSLPSIRSTFGDIKLSPPEQEFSRPGLAPGYPHSPPMSVNQLHQLPPLPSGPSSPPISPPDSHSRSLPSPRSLPASSPYPFANSIPHRPSVDYTSSAAGDPPGAEYGVPGSAQPGAGADRMSIDGITNHGNYVCTVSGCKAPPFQTQYLLNSHANVHSSARPHYCPVAGCSRSEGGKGFKRKNEMIRHGLVHESPGYVCPFCPDREHKYPRPDNLQRHVRVHHVDKNKDDPLLREVLAQRADGPNRGRRRRGGS